MHINDGILPIGVCLGGFGITGGLTWWSLHCIQYQPDFQKGIPKAALLTAVFFVSSSMRLPIPPASVHFVLNGLLGTLLGFYAFPSIVIGLFFQAVMFQHGGLTTLGVNGVIMGLPALVSAGIFQLASRSQGSIQAVTAFMAGAIGVGGALLLFFGIVITWIPADLNAATERAAIYALVLAHLPLLVVEGLFTAMVVNFLRRVHPALLRG